MRRISVPLYMAVTLLLGLWAFQVVAYGEFVIDLSSDTTRPGAIITLDCDVICDDFNAANFYLEFDNKAMEFIGLYEDLLADIASETGFILRSNASKSISSVNESGVIGVVIYNPLSDAGTSYFKEGKRLFSPQFRIKDIDEGLCLFSYDGLKPRGTAALSANASITWSTRPDGGQVKWIKMIDDDKQVTLPEDITMIEDGAFEDCLFIKRVAVRGEGLTSIGAKAFSGCVELLDIFIPISTVNIDANAFDECDKLTIHCADGSEAQRYAQAHRISYVIEKEGGLYQ